MKKKTESSQSKGERRNQRRDITNAARRDRKADYAYQLINKRAAWAKYQNPWLTLPNPNTNESKKFIRVKSNDYWGNPKAQQPFRMGQPGPEANPS